MVADRTNTTVGKLGASSAEIGSVVKMITSIAAQTNLLALNAMGCHVTEAAASSQDIARNIAGVSTAVGETTAVVQQAQASATGLARTSGELPDLVASFKL